MATTKNQNLGTIFTGKVDASFENAISRLQTSLKNTVGAMGKATSGAKSAGAGFSSAGDGANKFNKGMTLTKGQLTQVAGAFERLKRAFKIIASFGVAGSAVFAVVNAFKSGVKEIIDFDQALKNLEAITGATTGELEGMKSELIDIASVTKFSTTELAQGMVLLGQAGFDAGESINSLKAIAELATGTLSDMAFTADLMTTTLRAFNLDAIESGRVADVMANAVNGSKLTIDKLRTSFNYVGASASQVGLTLEETAATMMILANSGLRASTIGTGLRQVLSRLLAPTGRLKRAFEINGIVLEKVNPRLVGFQNAMKNLLPVIYDTKKQTIDMGKAYELFGLRGAQAVAVIGRSFITGAFNDMLDKTYEFGSASKMASIQAEGLGVKFKNLADRAKILGLALGDAGVGGILHDFVDILRDVVTGMTKFVETVGGQFVIKMAGWSLAIMGVVKGFQLLAATQIGQWFIFVTTSIYAQTAALGGLEVAVNLLHTAFARLAMNPIIAVALGLGALIAVLKMLSSRTEKHIKKLQEQAVEAGRTASALYVYQEALKKAHEKIGEGEETSKEYLSIIKRLIEAYPEWTTKIDILTLSYKQLNEEIAKYAKEKAKEEARALGDTIQELQKAIDKRQELIDKYRQGLIGKDPTNQKAQADKLTEKQVKDNKELESSIQSLVLSMIQQVEEGRLTELQAKALIRASIGFGEALEGVSTKAVNMFTKGLENVKKGLGEITTKVQTLPPVFKEVFDKLNDEDKLEFLERFGKLKDDISDMKNILKKFNIEGLDIEKTMNAQFLQEFWDKIEGIDKKIRQTKEKTEDLAVKNLEIEGNSIRALETQLMLLQDRERFLEDYIATRGQDLGELKRAEAENELAQIRSNILKTEIDLRDKKLDKQKKEWENDLKIEATSKTKLEALKDELRVTEDLYDILDVRAPKSEKDLENLKALQVQIAQLNRAILEEEFKETEELYDNGLINAEEYVKKLTVLFNKGVLSEVQYMKKKTTATGTWMERFKLGLQEGRESYGEFIVDLGKELPKTAVNNMVDSLLDFVDGTKSAKEAFKDFAESTLRWLAELILKTELYNWVVGSQESGGKSGMVNFFKGVGKGVASWFGGGGGEAVATGHKGGWGFQLAPSRMIDPKTFEHAKRYHGGLRPGELRAIIKGNERVMTPQDIRDLREGSGQGPINYFDISRSLFWDGDQLNNMIESIANNSVYRHAPSAIIRAMDSDHPIRNRIRSGF